MDARRRFRAEQPTELSPKWFAFVFIGLLFVVVVVPVKAAIELVVLVGRRIWR